MRDPGTEQAPNQRMRTARREREKPTGDIPRNGPDQGAEDHASVDRGGVDNAGAEGLRDVQPEYCKRDKIEECGPKHGRQGPQDAS